MDIWHSKNSIFRLRVSSGATRLTLELSGQYAFKPFSEYRRTIVYPILRLISLGSAQYHLLATDTRKNSSITQLLGDPIRTYGLYMIESEICEHPNPEISGYYRRSGIPDEDAWDALFVHGSILGWTGGDGPELLVEHLRPAGKSPYWLKDTCQLDLPNADFVYYALNDGHDLGIQLREDRLPEIKTILNAFDGPLFNFLQRQEHLGKWDMDMQKWSAL